MMEVEANRLILNWASLNDFLPPSAGMGRVGRNMANHFFFRALLRYGTFDEYHFFLFHPLLTRQPYDATKKEGEKHLGSVRSGPEERAGATEECRCVFCGQPGNRRVRQPWESAVHDHTRASGE